MVHFNGYWVNVEGLDGSGKTTFIDMLVDAIYSELDDREISDDIVSEVIVVKGLGEGELGQEVRRAIMTKYIEPKDTIYHTAMLTAVLDCQKFAKEAMQDSCIVISDRWLGSFFSYNCYASDNNQARQLFDIIVEDRSMVFPDKELYIDVPLDIALDRLSKRDDTNTLDKMGKEYYDRVVNGYKAWFTTADRQLGLQIDKIDNQGTLNELSIKIRQIANKIVTEALW